ncbi:oxygen-independent coproporphyrinogen-III oxidase-like protein YqeR [Clostridium saccharobutylicum]|uniref:radical SAM family heme chaperone HemW n=1 Tax=Clostridium saccharobutylicum TaxID=169679 RepID=UPI000983B102|nr:radical SAM family heme chaperone HemW [Clostridium saccharobutylicum]AQS09000.1 oxygen-independent coproporphyrinogen-III oxidase-like protein YqeR [Clostridium saccharobutylicum]MBC2435491.1 oxygen-independent coproporphyrinogen III oxidase [Clostridium saccharobutylicum]NSB87234.1 oxygen-independent coproporphyrinogen-3 oxidase [Clostridium saccharobutylicum]NYC28645.1 oxygen-independent coproporphyrinogen-3 oxidase [Clostridium saccharobutylicum]OOM18327.1 oxygen-independent coproporphy
MKEISLYIHIPFCKQKCLYCDFPSYAGKEILIDEYIESLNKEILQKGKDYIISSIFIGGGTPSYLNDDNLNKLLSTLNKLNLKDDLEFTVECNPGTLNASNLEIMKKYNVNRLSMGLQSTKDNILKNIGRVHNYEQFKENYFLARKIGFRNINVDLMFGLPDQTVNEWKESLEEIVKLNPEHISAYSLIIEEGTCFYNLYEKDKLKLPSEDEERLMYSYTKKILNNHGYHQYEISNFSKAGNECFHNKAYWKCNEYLGLGVSASSFIDKKRIKNIDNIREYIKRINNNESVEDEIHVNDMKDDIEEFMFMGLRMIEGISINYFKERFNKNIYEVYKEVIEKNINEGLLIYDSGKLYLSSKGIELSNYVMSDFILT